MYEFIDINVYNVVNWLFSIWFLYKSDLGIFILRKNFKEFLNQKLFNLKNDNIFHIFYQIKISGAPLWIRYCHPCIKWRLNSLLKRIRIWGRVSLKSYMRGFQRKWIFLARNPKNCTRFRAVANNPRTVARNFCATELRLRATL